MIIINKLFKIELSIDELELLNGKVSEEAQKTIDEAIKESSYGLDLPLMNEILKRSEKIGTLKWTRKSIRSCDYCDKKYDYYTYPRSGRYHNKGDKNHNKPIYYSGIKFNEGLVTIAGVGDMCSDCCTKHKVIEKLIDYILDKDLKIEIMRNDYKVSRYLKDDIKVCYSCNSEMQESKMTRESTVMGDGTYPSGCPNCGAKSLPFGKSHRITNKFDFVYNPAARAEVQVLRDFVNKFNNDKEKSDDKLNLSQSKWNKQVFTVFENKFTNGYRDVASVHLEKSFYEIGYFYENKVDGLEFELGLLGLTRGKIRR